MSELPKVSVLIPAFNQERYIDEAIRGVLMQAADYPAELIETIVVDDGSSDDTAARARTYGDRVRVISKPNGGLLSSVNRLIQESTGDLVCFLGGDDFFLPGHVSRYARFLLANPWVSLAYSDVAIVDAASRPTHESFLALNNLTPVVGDISGRLLTSNFISPVGAMMRAEVARRAWPLGPPACWEDWWLHWNSMQVGAAAFLGGVDACYRRHGANMVNGVHGEEAVRRVVAPEIPFKRWLITEGWREGIPYRDVATAWDRLASALHESVSHGIGTLHELVPVGREERTRAGDLVSSALSRATPPHRRAICLFQALALVPDHEVAHAALPEALRSAECDSPPVCVDGSIIVATASEVIHRPHLLSRYLDGAAALGVGAPALLLDARCWSEERVREELVPVAEECGVLRSEANVMVVTDGRPWPSDRVVGVLTEVEGTAAVYGAPSIGTEGAARVAAPTV